MKCLNGLILFSVFALSACGTLRYYPLPLPAGEARAMMPAIATAANNLGYKQWASSDQVHVAPNDTMDVFYHLSDDGSLRMTVMIKDKHASDETIAAAKATADQVFNEAVALRRATAVPTATTVIQSEPPKPGVQINIGR